MKIVKNQSKSKFAHLKSAKAININRLDKIKGGKATNGVVTGLCVVDDVDA